MSKVGIDAIFCLILILCMAEYSFCSMRNDFATDSDNLFMDEDELNLYCLKKSYPQIVSLAEEPDGKWLNLQNGQRVLYSRRQAESVANSLDVDVAASMEQPYPLEPERPPTPSGISPGRKRSYALFESLYGKDKNEVLRTLRPSLFLGKNISLNADAARAFGASVPALERLAREKPQLKPLLRPAGGFNWRAIAGETALSAHSYGIAVDIGANNAPYWRWSGRMPHPMQATYPSEIVRALEEQGFIWGGKWHEYDLMHYEYRPEIICKARIRAGLAY